MGEHDIHTRRENAREASGQFGEQNHSAPEAELTELPDFRSDHARQLDAKLAEVRAQRDGLMEERREAHLVDVARLLPAGVRRVTFRTEYDRDGEKHMLMFDSAEDESDMVDLDKPLLDHLYAVAWDFGQPGDFVADDWMDGEDEHYWIDLDEETALDQASRFRAEMQSAQSLHGIAPLHLHHGHVAWTERAMRTRAHEAGITAIHFDVPEDAAGVRVIGFDHADHGTITPDDSNGDHMFLVGQGQQFPHRTDSMVSADGRLTLKV